MELPCEYGVPTQLIARSGAISGLLAFGLGQLDHVWGYRGWRFIYVVEGVISFVVALGAYFWITDSPERSKRFTKQERRYIVLRGTFTYGGNQGGTKDDFTWRDFASAAKVKFLAGALRLIIQSWHVWVLSFSSFSYCVGAYAFSLMTVS